MAAAFEMRQARVVSADCQWHESASFETGILLLCVRNRFQGVKIVDILAVFIKLPIARLCLLSDLPANSPTSFVPDVSPSIKT